MRRLIAMAFVVALASSGVAGAADSSDARFDALQKQVDALNAEIRAS